MDQKTNRRHFLRNSAAFIGGFIVCPVVVSAQQSGAQVPIFMNGNAPIGYPMKVQIIYSVDSTRTSAANSFYAGEIYNGGTSAAGTDNAGTEF